MRYFAAVASVLLFALCTVTCGAAAAESGDFTEWASKQSDACDRNWNNFVQAQPVGEPGQGEAIHASHAPEAGQFEYTDQEFLE